MLYCTKVHETKVRQNERWLGKNRKGTARQTMPATKINGQVSLVSGSHLSAVHVLPSTAFIVECVLDTSVAAAKVEFSQNSKIAFWRVSDKMTTICYEYDMEFHQFSESHELETENGLFETVDLVSIIPQHHVRNIAEMEAPDMTNSPGVYQGCRRTWIQDYNSGIMANCFWLKTVWCMESDRAYSKWRSGLWRAVEGWKG